MPSTLDMYSTSASAVGGLYSEQVLRQTKWSNWYSIRQCANRRHHYFSVNAGIIITVASTCSCCRCHCVRLAQKKIDLLRGGLLQFKCLCRVCMQPHLHIEEGGSIWGLQIGCNWACQKLRLQWEWLCVNLLLSFCSSWAEFVVFCAYNDGYQRLEDRTCPAECWCNGRQLFHFVPSLTLWTIEWSELEMVAKILTLKCIIIFVD